MGHGLLGDWRTGESGRRLYRGLKKSKLLRREKEEKVVSCLACGVGMPRVKRLHHHRPHHGTHFLVAGHLGRCQAGGVRNSRERKARTAR